MISEIKKIKQRIKRYEQGHFFILDDFLDISNRDNSKVALNRLIHEGSLTRVYNGIYQKPKFNKTFHLPVPPTTNEIVQQIARKNSQHIVPAGDTALNILGLSTHILGLSTQVPATYSYITNGPSRNITIPAFHSAKLRHSGTKTFFQDDMVNLIFESLGHLSDEDVNETVLKTLADHIDRQKYQELQQDSKYSTQRIRQLVSKIGDFIHD